MEDRIQEVFNRIKETKQKAKEIKAMYKDALDGSLEYKEVCEKLENLKVRKKQLEIAIKEESKGEMQKLDAYKMHVKTDTELLSELAINKLIEGEVIRIKDQYDQEYEPVFAVKFKKANVVAK